MPIEDEVEQVERAGKWLGNVLIFLGTSRFLLAPFLIVVIGPGCWAMWAMTHGLWKIGLPTLLLWAMPFSDILAALNERSLVRYPVSVTCTALVLVAALFVK
jgi:hypothetical protein